MQQLPAVQLDAMQAIIPRAPGAAWYLFSERKPEFPQGGSVRVTAIYRDQLVSGSYTRPVGYSYDTFVFNNVLLSNCLPDVYAWCYSDDFMESIQASIAWCTNSHTGAIHDAFEHQSKRSAGS